MERPIQRLFSHLAGVRRNGHGWVARCPAHDDREPSLSLDEGDDGRALVHCHAGCQTEHQAQGSRPGHRTGLRRDETVRYRPGVGRASLQREPRCAHGQRPGSPLMILFVACCAAWHPQRATNGLKSINNSGLPCCAGGCPGRLSRNKFPSRRLLRGPGENRAFCCASFAERGGARIARAGCGGVRRGLVVVLLRVARARARNTQHQDRRLGAQRLLRFGYSRRNSRSTSRAPWMTRSTVSGSVSGS